MTRRLFLLLLLSLATSRGEERSETHDLSADFGTHTGAFVLFDESANRWLRYRPEACKVRTSPCSTFKIPNSLIALETGVASGADFTIPWDGTKRSIEAWNRDQTLRSAYSVSCVWYYQELARRIGMKRYQETMPKLNYGNGDLSGGVDQFWLESSLTISPDEQVDFLRRLHGGKLPFSERAVDVVLDIMTLSKVDEVTFRGKTGTGGSLATNEMNLGWFVGSVTTPKGNYYFATRLTGGTTSSGREARRITEAILAKLMVFPPTK